jgi:hypothetical protein
MALVARLRPATAALVWSLLAVVHLAAPPLSWAHVGETAFEERGCCCHGHDEHAPEPADREHDCDGCALCRVAASPPLPTSLAPPLPQARAISQAPPLPPDVVAAAPQRRLADARGPPAPGST